MTQSPDGTVLNFAVVNGDELKKRHYVLNPKGHSGRWVAFYENKVRTYRSQANDEFCLLIACDQSLRDDFYAIPYREIQDLVVPPNAYVARTGGRESRQWKMRLKGAPHRFQFEVSQPASDQRPEFAAKNWYGNYFALGVPEIVDDHLDMVAVTAPEEVPPSSPYYVGASRTIVVNVYERNIPARKACLLHYGLSCSVCAFNFRDEYGEAGKGLIHVHHVRQLSEIRERYVVNPIEDLRHVCPNCHAMIHRRCPPYGIDEVREMLRRN